MRGLRELLIPAEFRIPDAGWAQRWIEEFRDLLRYRPSGERQDAEKAMIARVSVSLWRVRQKLSTTGTDTLTRDLDRLVGSAWDALTQAGVEVVDHTGEMVTGGESFSVLAYEAQTGLSRERVIETIRPFVFLDGVMLQAGHVIVGKPARDGGIRSGE